MSPRPGSQAGEKLKRALDALYDDYDFAARVRHNPIQLPKRYRDPRDVEAAAFIASSLAYGSVRLFIPVAGRILNLMGSSPSQFLAGFPPRRDGKRFHSIKYRFNETEDILALFHAIGTLLRRSRLRAAWSTSCKYKFVILIPQTGKREGCVRPSLRDKAVLSISPCSPSSAF